MMGGDDGLADGQADTHTLAGIRTPGIVVGARLEDFVIFLPTILFRSLSQ